MLSVPEVSEHFRVGRDTVLSWITAGELKAIDVAPSGSQRKFYRISEDSLAEFERKRRLVLNSRRKLAESDEKDQIPAYI